LTLTNRGREVPDLVVVEPRARDGVDRLDVHPTGVAGLAARLLVALHLRLADDELHHLVGVVVLDVVRPRVVEQLDGLALHAREVDDDLVALGHAVAEALDRLRVLHEPAVGREDGQRGAVAQPPAVAARDARVEDAEAVLARLDRHGRPRHPVDEDDVAVDAGLAVVGVDELPVLRGHRVADHERLVVVARREVQRGVHRIVDDVYCAASPM
jgi:hypothetical protein